MKRFLNLLIVLALFDSISFSQDFSLEIPNKTFVVEAGTGIDTQIKAVVNGGSGNPVILSAAEMEGVIAVFQPGTINETDTVVLSLLVNDLSLEGQTIEVDISATDNVTTIDRKIDLHVIEGTGAYIDDQLAREYRDSAISFIRETYPASLEDFGNMMDFEWSGFWPYPPLDIVSHYVYLYGNWRVNVLWHVMVPPYDWKKIFIYNEEENVSWGVMIDTDSICSEILVEKLYYFNQDTNEITFVRKSFDSEAGSVVFPNPFRDQTTISFDNRNNESYMFNLYNSNGELVKVINNIRNDRFTLYNDDLLPGIYYYRLSGRKVYIGKLLIQ